MTPSPGLVSVSAAVRDQLGATFSGSDIEPWPGRGLCVVVADARDPLSYLRKPFTIVTSPVYANKRYAHDPNGPTSWTKVKGRRDLRASRPWPRALTSLTWPAIRGALVETHSCTGRVTLTRSTSPPPPA